MSRRLAAAAAALLACSALSGTLGSAATTPAPGGLPGGWHRAQARLVPDLLMPRERISVATFAMAVGGGGNCGREPVASIQRMRPGDALVSIQEYVVTARMRRDLTRTFTPRGAIRLGGLRGGPILRATIPFSAGTRAFDALVYTAGRPSTQLRRQIESLLTGLPLPGAAPF